MNRSVDRLLQLLAEKGTRQYGEEKVSQCEHALQSAALAEHEGAAGTLVVAALLHDIGHLLYDGERPAARGIDDRHEELGAAYLAQAFGPAVAEPVRLHVPAKRYLCATDPGYFGRLSAASVRSLELQGGPFTVPDASAFLALPYADDALRVRRWDDFAKIPGHRSPDLQHYRTALLAASID